MPLTKIEPSETIGEFEAASIRPEGTGGLCHAVLRVIQVQLAASQCQLIANIYLPSKLEVRTAGNRLCSHECGKFAAISPARTNHDTKRCLMALVIVRTKIAMRQILAESVMAETISAAVG